MEIVCYSFCWFLIIVDQSKGGIFWIEEREQLLLVLLQHKLSLPAYSYYDFSLAWLESARANATKFLSHLAFCLINSQYVSVDSSTWWIPYYFEVRQIWISKAERNRITSWISKVLKLFVKKILWFDTK